MNLETVCMNISIGLLIIDENKKIIKVNPFLLQQFGYSESELLGASSEILVPNDHLQGIKKHVFDFNKKATIIEIDVLAVKKNGEEFPAEIILDYVKTEDGNFIIALINDISIKKNKEIHLRNINEELEARMKDRTELMSQTVKEMAKLIEETEIKDKEILKVNLFLNNIWNFAQIIFMATDKNGLVKMFNHSAEKQLGYTATEVVDIKETCGFFDNNSLKLRHQQLELELNNTLDFPKETLTIKSILGLDNEFESVFVKKDGSTFPVLVTINKIVIDNKIQGYILVGRNISIQKKAEIEIQNALVKEKELGEIQREFLSLASHELRTPLSVVLSSANIISLYDAKQDYSKIEKHVQRIVSAVNTLRDILDDFLSMNKIQEGKIEVINTLVDIKFHVNETINELRDLLKPGQKVVYRHHEQSNYLIDARMLKYIIVNLLSNAIKFSPEGSIISIDTKIVDQQFMFMIKDQGRGISEEDQKQLFNRYFRGTNVNTIQGTGLGLHIVKQYVELMKGTIKLKSKLGKGTSIQLLFNNDF